MFSEYALLVYMLIFDAIMGITVPLEFIIHEIRYRRELRKHAVSGVASPVPQRPSLRWPFVVVLCAGLVSTFAFVIYLQRPVPVQPQGFGFNEGVQKPPSAPRSKQTINELINESTALLDIMDRASLRDFWSVAFENPEKVCVDLNAKALQERVSQLSSNYKSAQSDIAAILDKNRIDPGFPG